MASAGTKAFPTYLELPKRVPVAAWIVTRVLVLAATLALVVLLVVRPELTRLFVLQLAIPLLPIVFVAVPGLWRQVCPMAQLNQLPRQLGIGRNRTLPQAWKNGAYLLSALLFMAIVSLRPVVLNDQPLALAGLLLAGLALALGGGLLFKGRSGWCGTFCPLAPLQRAYGQAPLVMVRNGYCPTCVGCQKNCYDFNPRAAIHSDLADADSFLAGHKEFFIACLPGLVLGYFLAGEPDQIGIGAYYLNFLLWIGVSLAICTTATRLVPHSRYRVALLASMAALLIFYWFATPAMMAALGTLTGVVIPGWVGTLLLGGVLAVAGAMVLRGLQAERDHARIEAATASAGATVDLATVKAAWAGATDLIFDRGSGLSIAAAPGRSLLESLESAGVSIDFGCRMGVCGADPVAIIGGADQLSAPGEDEAATLRRLGLTGRARMACVCRPTGGGVTIDTKLDPRTLPEPDNDQSPGDQPRTDPAPELGVGRVVIIGNGSAGTTVADELRRLSPSVKIDLLAEEPHQFYNRMAIGRLVHAQSSVDSLYLMRQDWARARKIDLWLNTVATGIDLARSQVTLGTEEKLDYDRLVLAAGGSASVPPIPGWGIPGCFVLRSANDAISIRAWRQR
ncbi:MAG TPA: FAD-dependent oxidoreductase, partial [Sphingomicrobium sp.]|nr:FAD-dependent oxidoreductase [Sphingomicrobium sp.]